MSTHNNEGGSPAQEGLDAAFVTAILVVASFLFIPGIREMNVIAALPFIAGGLAVLISMLRNR